MYAYTWPGFLWKLLTNLETHKSYDDYIWRFNPDLWRHWWMGALMPEHGDIYNCITIELPPTFFKDIMMEYKEFQYDIESYLLSKLANSCNKHLLPNVLCPWGCTDFIHRLGHLPLDVVFQRYFKKIHHFNHFKTHNVTKY